MRKQSVRWPLAAAAVLFFAAGLSPIPAAAGSTPPPSPAQGRSQADLGILSLRRQLLSGVKPSASFAPKAPLTIACAAVWRVVDGQSRGWNNVLGGMAAVSPTDMWAVGSSQANPSTGFGIGDLNLAEHWDGNAWGIVSTPQPGSDSNDLNAVAATATGDAWAVGVSISGGINESSAFHWDGSTWGPDAAPRLTGTSVLSAVTAVTATNYWAAGQQWSVAESRWVTLVEHWDGSSWSDITAPNLGAGDNILYGVGSDSAGDVWAVGYYQAQKGFSSHLPLIEHMSGGLFQPAASPPGDTLISVAGASATDAVAVGYSIGSNGLPVGITFHWDGSAWNAVGVSEPSVFGEVISHVVFSSSGYWAVGFGFGNGGAPGYRQAFALQGNGTSWQTSGQNGFPAMASKGAGDHVPFSVAVPAAGDVWVVGTFVGPSIPGKTLIENYSGLYAPAGVTATPGDQSATVNWSPPCSSGGSTITSYVVTAYDGCTVQGSTAVSGAATVTANVTGLTNGTAYTFKVAAINGFGVGPQSAPTSAVTPAGPSQAWVTACSTTQYTLPGNNGSTWADMDATNLSVSFKPAADSIAVLSGNVDLWTANAGYNQDIGIAVSGGVTPTYPTVTGQPEAWKESGGFAGTFSPNAAYVQSFIPVKSGQTYSARLQWKANKPDAGSIFAGAGPIGSAFSPTRLTVQLLPNTSARAFSGVGTTQYQLNGSNGSTWTEMDPTNLSVPFTVPSAGNWIAIVSGNADLWTGSAGYNQDIGVSLAGPGFPTVAGQPEAWKESGGFAGTFSPNAAFVQVSLPVTVSTTYMAKLQWKTNKPDPGSIFAGAGPIGPKFSPTRLTVLLYPAPRLFAGGTQQFQQPSSDGAYWQPVDASAQISLAPSVATSYMISGNSDLWTANAGYNQDIGIMVSGGAYGPGTLVAWKESGGFAGTFSPNAAFVTTDVQLQAGQIYTAQLVWKTNRVAQAANMIFGGAGPINANFSPTSLIAVPLT